MTNKTLNYAARIALALASFTFSASLVSARETKPSELEQKVASVEVKKSELPEKYSFIKVYDVIIEKYVAEFNKKHNINLDSDLVRAMIIKESGDKKDRDGAFKYDPMQIANQGDYALRALANGKEDTKMIGDFSRLKDKKNTPWDKKKKCWNYTNSNMDPNSSIYGGIGWFLNKAVETVEKGTLTKYEIKSGDSLWKIAKQNGSTLETLKKYNLGIDYDNLKIGQIINFKKAKRTFDPNGINWEEAVRRYNGEGDPNYVEKVFKLYKELKSN